MLVGGLPGGLGNISNYGPVLLYVALTAVVWIPLELYSRSRERADRDREAASPPPPPGTM
jgi:hypothetical protein